MGPAGDEDHEGHDEDGLEDDRLGDDPLGHDDEPPLGAPPDRMDRIWVHPAELSPVAPPPRRRSRRSALLMPLATGALGAVAAIVVLGLLGAFDGDPEQRRAQQVEQQIADQDEVLSRLARAVAPGLVLVTVKDGTTARQSSGVCVRHSGEILTSAATVGTAETVTVKTTTGETLPATVIGRDDVSGLALLDTGRALRAVPVSEASGRPGDSVWIFGAQRPRQASPWISGGVVASVDALVANATGPMTGGLLETDALSTAWAAGGALVDRSGAVSGIVLAPIGEHPGAYAVPITRAIKVADELREHGYVAHGAMPIAVVDGPAGPTVMDVPPDSLAARDGVLVGDVIIAVDSREVLDVAEFVATIQSYAPGNVVELELVRGSEPLKLEVTLSSTMPEAAAGG
jgi:putative serine protease PepD